MPTNQINLDDFPHSAYADELRRGLGRLYFEAPLEAEYQAAHLQRVLKRARIWHSVNVVVSILFTVDQVRSTGVGSFSSLAHLIALVPTVVALAWLAWSRQYARWYPSAAPVLVTISSALIATFVVRAIVLGHGEQLAAFTLFLVGVFFFTGLMFRQAVLSSGIMLVAYTGAAIALHLPSIVFIKCMVIITLTSAVAAIVYRDTEQAYRRSFLEAELISGLAARDGLSGLMNRRAFDEHLVRVWQQAMRDKCPIAILMIDIDYFKQYNDSWGHQAGDAALRSVAKVIQGLARRPSDLAARYGGEEFALIFYDVSLPYVLETAEQLRVAVHSVELNPHEMIGGQTARVTISVGAGLAAPTVGRTPEGLIQLADEALYEAKNAGRNRAIVKGTEAYGRLKTGTFNLKNFARR
jgi:diguanylate cyclase (GGDEF)-like protein